MGVMGETLKIHIPDSGTAVIKKLSPTLLKRSYIAPTLCFFFFAYKYPAAPSFQIPKSSYFSKTELGRGDQKLTFF